RHDRCRVRTVSPPPWTRPRDRPGRPELLTPRRESQQPTNRDGTLGTVAPFLRVSHRHLLEATPVPVCRAWHVQVTGHTRFRRVAQVPVRRVVGTAPHGELGVA